MSQIRLEELANEQRIRDENILAIIAYVPFGIVLVLLRVIIGIFVWLSSAILPEISPLRIYVSNFTCLALGLSVKIEGVRENKTRIIIANSVSVFDPLALHSAARTITPSKWDLPPPLSWALGIRHLGSPSSNEQFKEAIIKKFSDIPDVPITIQPEGCPTSGRGLLKFSEWPFMINTKIQPVAIEAKRYFGNITVPTLNHWNSDGIPWADLFYFLWNPRTIYTINYLPSIERGTTETSEEFANRTQRLLADKLKVEATTFTSNELRTLITNRETEREVTNSSANRRETPQQGSSTPNLMRMAEQVKEVLPAVPLSVILSDLGRTRCVNLTITNILEGVVPYTPEEETKPPVPSSNPALSPPHPPPPHQPLNTAASTFQRTAEGRMLSFRERKTQLITEAKKRYCEKHGLTHLL